MPLDRLMPLAAGPNVVRDFVPQVAPPRAFLHGERADLLKVETPHRGVSTKEALPNLFVKNH